MFFGPGLRGPRGPKTRISGTARPRAPVCPRGRSWLRGACLVIPMPGTAPRCLAPRGSGARTASGSCSSSISHGRKRGSTMVDAGRVLLPERPARRSETTLGHTAEVQATSRIYALSRVANLCKKFFIVCWSGGVHEACKEGARARTWAARGRKKNDGAYLWASWQASAVAAGANMAWVAVLNAHGALMI